MTVRRDWSDARRKIEEEGRCRLCSATGVKLDAAHILGRRYDRPRVPGSATKVLYVHPDSVIPLCHDQVVEATDRDGRASSRVRKGCHTRFDSGEVSILAILNPDEQVRAVQDAGGIELARRRIDAPDYREAIEQARRKG